MTDAIFLHRFSTAVSSTITLSDEDSFRAVELDSDRGPSIPRPWIHEDNYFFEWTVWLGYAVYGLAFEYGWIALGAQALIVTSILKVTGIPATEAQALRSKGDAYRWYQARVSRFIPRPPKRL